MTIFVNHIEYNSPEHGDASRLRAREIYAPLGIEFNKARITLDKDKKILGLFDDETLIGTVVTKTEENTVAIEEIVVRRDKRRQHLGSQLLAHLSAHLEKDQILTAKGPLSSRPFFEKNGFRIQSKHKGTNDRMVLDFEKNIKADTKNPIPLYDDIQNKPLVYFTLQTQGFEMIPILRNYFPKEHLIVVDLLKDDAHWLHLAETVKKETAKFTLIAPELYGNRKFHPLDDFNLPKAAAEIADKTSKTKTILLMGEKDVLAANDYRAAFEAQNPSLSTVELIVEREGAHTDYLLDADFYGKIVKNLDTLKDKNFDTLIVVNSSLSTQSDAIEKFLEDQLTRNLYTFDISHIVIQKLREQLLKQNHLRHRSTKGVLNIFSETPDRARAALKRLHPEERSAKIDTLR